MKMRLTLQATLVSLLAFASYASAQDLVYTPVNPSFGGSPFNSAHLLAIAEIDRPDAPEDDDLFDFDFGFEDSQADQFTRQLESRILSQLSFDIVDKIFNGSTQTGTFEFGTTSLFFEKLLDGSVKLAITDIATGGVTNILIPSFLIGNN